MGLYRSGINIFKKANWEISNWLKKKPFRHTVGKKEYISLLETKQHLKNTWTNIENDLDNLKADTNEHVHIERIKEAFSLQISKGIQQQKEKTSTHQDNGFNLLLTLMLSKKVNDYVKQYSNQDEVASQDMNIVNLTNNYIKNMRMLAMKYK